MITRNMKEATNQVATGRAVRYSEGLLRECVSAGLLVIEFGEYTPTQWGYEVSNEVSADRAMLEQLRRGSNRRAA